MLVILEQAFVEIWLPCNCNQTPNGASQLMQVCCVLFIMLLFRSISEHNYLVVLYISC